MTPDKPDCWICEEVEQRNAQLAALIREAIPWVEEKRENEARCRVVRQVVLDWLEKAKEFL